MAQKHPPLTAQKLRLKPPSKPKESDTFLPRLKEKPSLARGFFSS